MSHTTAGLPRPSRVLCILALAGAVGSVPALAQGLNEFVAEDPVVIPAGPLDAQTIYLRTGAVRAAERRAIGALAAGEARARHIVVQLDGPMTPERRARLEAAGVRLGEYLPINSYIATIAPDADQARLNGLDFIRWASAFQNDWKTDPTLGKRAILTEGDQALANAGLVRAWVYLFPGEDANATVNSLRAIPGVQVAGWGDLGPNPQITVTMTPDAVPAVAALESVQFIEEALEATLRNNTSRTIVQSGTTTLTPFYANGITGLGQVVGLQDSKMNIAHCSFVDTPNTPGPAHRKVLAYNTTTGSSSHGTHTAGTLAGDSGSFTDNLRGVAYQAKIVFDDIPNDSSTGTVFLANLNLHHDQGARVHSNSWGNDGTTTYTGWCRAIDLHSRDREDSVVAFAVSNGSLATTPENAKSCLAVGATQDNASINNHCSGGTGPTTDGRRKPETYAPGCSTTSSSGSACATANLTGTSMACPAITGACALLRQYFVEGYYPTGAEVPVDGFNPSGALIRAAVINASIDMTGVAGYPSNREGWGRLVADNAAFFTGDERTLIVHDIWNASPEAFTTPGQQQEFTFQVDGSTQQLRVTLTFTDVAAAINAAFAPVNDVDLEVVDPNGDAVYLGNVFAAGVSTTGGARDDRNSTEQVHITNPAIGTWTARVKSAAVSSGTQGFALVITGQVLDQLLPCRGDTNGDRLVNFDDLNTVLSQFGMTGPGLSGDVNGDLIVNFEDLNEVISFYGVCATN